MPYLTIMCLWPLKYTVMGDRIRGWKMKPQKMSAFLVTGCSTIFIFHPPMWVNEILPYWNITIRLIIILWSWFYWLVFFFFFFLPYCYMHLKIGLVSYLKFNKKHHVTLPVCVWAGYLVVTGSKCTDILPSVLNNKKR